MTLAEQIAFRDGDRPLELAFACPNIFMFCVLMAATVAAKRGGTNTQYLRECSDFMREVIGRRLSVNDKLPDDYDWSAGSAIEAANAMMEYDA